MDFTDKLETLAANAKPTAKSLLFLSDLSREDRAALGAAWPALPAARRRQIVRTLVDLAEDNVDLDFRAAFQIMLDDAEEAVRLAAIEGLWEDESMALLRRLLELLAHDPAPAVRAAAANALGRFSYRAELGKLREDRVAELRAGLLAAAQEATAPVDVRRRAIESLGYLARDPAVAAEIRAAYGSPAPLPVGAIYAMGRSMNPQWAAILLHELGSPAPAMRYEAARALGELGDRAHVVALLPLLDDRDIEVQQAAIWTLGQLGGREATVALLRLKDSPESAIQEAVTEALDEVRYTANPLTPV